MLTKKFNLIACINKVGALGKDQKLLYRITNDLRKFRELTTNNVVIMGRKTFESLPNQRPLPNRINVILSTKTELNIQSDDVFVVSTIDDAVDLCSTLFPDKEWFVIGGASIYKGFLDNDLIGKAYITEVKDDSPGDVYLESFKKTEWKILNEELNLLDCGWHYTFTIYQKKHF